MSRKTKLILMIVQAVLLLVGWHLIDNWKISVGVLLFFFQHNIDRHVMEWKVKGDR